RFCRDGQVGAAFCVPQIGARRAPAPAAGRRRLVIAGALLARSVEIIVRRDAGLDRGLDHRVAQRAAHRVRDVERPAGPVMLVGAPFLVLGLLEERQHAVPIPAFAAALPPIVVIGWRAAHIDHAVDRTGAAQNLAARLVQGAAVELRLGLGLEHPIEPRVRVGLRVAERDVDPGIAVGSAGLQQQHAVFPALAEPPGDGATCGARPGHDKIESLRRSCHNVPPAPLNPPARTLDQTKPRRKGRPARDLSAFSLYDKERSGICAYPAIGYARAMIVCRIFGWVLLVAGFSALLRDGLVWFDTGRWVPLAIGDLRGWSAGVPELVLLLSVAPPLIVLGSVALAICRRRRFRRRPS